MTVLGVVLMLSALVLLAFALGNETPSWPLLVAFGGVFVTGLVLAIRSRLVRMSQQVAYAIREVRAAWKDLPEPPAPRPDLAQTINKPIKAVPRPEVPRDH